MRTVYLLCILAGMTAGSSLAQGPADSRTQTDQVLRQIIEAQAAAWNRGDGPGFASAFSEDADFVNIRGDVFHGREAIGQRHTRILAEAFKGSHLSITVRQLTEPAPGVALVETDQKVTRFLSLPPGIAPTSKGVIDTHMKYVALRRDGQWLVIAAQNTAVLPAAAPLK